MKNLSKDEMKKVMGGVMMPNVYCCHCTGDDTGAWTYTNSNGVSQQTGLSDIGDYCKHGFGNCSTVQSDCPLD